MDYINMLLNSPYMGYAIFAIFALYYLWQKYGNKPKKSPEQEVKEAIEQDEDKHDRAFEKVCEEVAKIPDEAKRTNEFKRVVRGARGIPRKKR